MGEEAARRPAAVCRALLAALEGRRRMRKRDQTPDAIGLAIKRDLLVEASAADPDPAAFEAWLLEYVQAREETACAGAVSAMARTVFDEWRLACAMREFGDWLDRGAPTADADAAPSRDESAADDCAGARRR